MQLPLAGLMSSHVEIGLAFRSIASVTALQIVAIVQMKLIVQVSYLNGCLFLTKINNPLPFI